MLVNWALFCCHLCRKILFNNLLSYRLFIWCWWSFCIISYLSFSFDAVQRFYLIDESFLHWRFTHYEINKEQMKVTCIANVPVVQVRHAITINTSGQMNNTRSVRSHSIRTMNRPQSVVWLLGNSWRIRSKQRDLFDPTWLLKASTVVFYLCIWFFLEIL